VFAFGLLSLSTLLAAQKTATKPVPREQSARAFIRLLDKGEFAQAAKSFDATMLRVLPPDELKKTWQKVVGQAGAFQKQQGSRGEASGKYDAVLVTCEFARATLDARVVFDKDGKITGLLFKKPKFKGTEEIWEGTLKAGAVELRLVIHLFRQKDGSYAGTFDSPDQGASGIVLDDVRVKDDTVRVELKSAKIVFEGKRDKEGRLAGDFKQAGQSFPLKLKKVAKAQKVRRPQLPKKPYPYNEIEVAYENKKGGIKLAGALTEPRSGGPFPAVVLITGSGPQDRDETLFGHKPFLVLADYLTRRGIAVLRVDDRGVGGSTGNVSDATTADFAGDVQAGVDFLKGRMEIDAGRIGLIGHSEGGIIAPLVASRSRDIAFIVMLAGTGLPGEQVLYEQGAAILKATGADAAKLARQKAIQERMFAVVRQEKDNAAAEKKIKAAIKELTETLSKDEKKEMAKAMSQVEGQAKVLLTPWFRFFLTYDPRPALRKVMCPVLALNGEKDLQVDARVHLKAIAAALKEGGNKDFTTRELPRLNHLFQTCKTGAVSEYGAIEETLAPVALETIAKWIAQRTGGPARNK
jgi:fermentation-respiration switch protein FrsA (DUF1100 family)